MLTTVDLCSDNIVLNLDYGGGYTNLPIAIAVFIYKIAQSYTYILYQYQFSNYDIGLSLCKM